MMMAPPDIENKGTVFFVKEELKRKSFAGLLLTYFNFAYYLGMSPFRFKDIHGISSIITWWLPKLIWTVVLVPCILFRVAESRDILHEFSSDWNRNPSAYFRVFHALAKIFFHAVLWYYLGFQSSKYLNVVNFIYESTDLPVPEIKPVVWKIVPPTVYITFATLGIFIGTTYVGRFMECHTNGEKDYLGLMFQFCVNWGKYVLFASSQRVRCEDTIPPTSSFSSSDIFVGVATGVATILRHVNGFYEELHIPTGIFIFWLCSREFANRLRSLSLLCVSSGNKGLRAWETALAWYSSLKDFSVVIKDAYGEILLQRLLLMIFDVPLSFEYRSSDLVNQVRFIILFLISALLYILAADSSKQIKSFEAWISKMVNLNVHGISQQQLSVILHELQSNAVGVSTSIGFTITYAFVANVSGILITYFIICVQNYPSTLND